MKIVLEKSIVDNFFNENLSSQLIAAKEKLKFNLTDPRIYQTDIGNVTYIREIIRLQISQIEDFLKLYKFRHYSSVEIDTKNAVFLCLKQNDFDWFLGDKA